MNEWWIAIALGGAVLVGLAVYCGLLWRRVFALRRKQAAEAAELAAKRQHWAKSIETIARAALADQANITECAIRIKVLMDGLTGGDCPKEAYRPIYELAWATAHMPILEQRKAFKRSEILAFDQEREAFEEAMGEDVKQAMQQLLDNADYWP
ncbi:MAG: DUF2489 domain-containing protein [Pseudomonadota bacterium]